MVSTQSFWTNVWLGDGAVSHAPSLGPCEVWALRKWPSISMFLKNLFIASCHLKNLKTELCAQSKLMPCATDSPAHRNRFKQVVSQAEENWEAESIAQQTL